MTPCPLLVAAATLAIHLAPVVATASDAAPIVASGAWSRPAAEGLSTGVAYLALRNEGRIPDRLLGASTPVAARASLHQSMSMGGMMSMTPVTGGLPLAPGATTTLAPGGYHLMLEGLAHGLRAGDHYPLTLRFAHAAPLTVSVAVQTAAPPSAP